MAPKGEAALERSIAYWQKAQNKVLKTLGQDRWTRMLSDLSALAALAAKSSDVQGRARTRDPKRAAH